MVMLVVVAVLLLLVDPIPVDPAGMVLPTYPTPCHVNRPVAAT